MKIIIDPGHGGKDFGGGSNSYWLEKDMNFKISLYQYRLFKQLGINVTMTRFKDEYIDLENRAKIVRDSNSDICISNHINNYTDTSVRGAEIIYSIYSDGKLAKEIMEEIVKEGASKRNVFSKEHPNNFKQDYYYMNRHTGRVQTIIIEYGFASNKLDTKKILKNWRKYSNAVVRGTLNYLNIPYSKSIELTPIIGNTASNIVQMKNWAKKNNATDKFIIVAEKYMKYGELTKIRPEVLYAQSAKETNFGRYTGVVKENMNNFAGIKIKKPKGDLQKDHERFDTLDDGIRAHFNHIAAYVGINPIGKVHGRYFVVKSLPWAGSIKYVEELGGKWSPNINYGRSIVNNYLNELLMTEYNVTNNRNSDQNS